MMRSCLDGALLSVCYLLTCGVGHAQDIAPQPQDSASDTSVKVVARQLAIKDSIERANRNYKVGITVGWRQLIDGDGVYRNAVIDPTTYLVRVDDIDKGDLTLSGVVIAFPWTQLTETRIRRAAAGLGFVANINVATFGSDGVATFNKSIEGGLGIAYRLGDDFGIGVTYERVFSRRLRRFVTPDMELIVDGEKVESLSIDDGRFFTDDDLSALALRFIFLVR